MTSATGSATDYTRNAAGDLTGVSGAAAASYTYDGADAQFYLSDAHGSTVALTGSTGAVDGTWTYCPWGAVASHTGTASTPIMFAGAYTDAETRFLYLQAPYYDPSTALFPSVDALVSLARQAYLYVADNPLNGLDTTGLFDWGMAIGTAAGVVGIASILATDGMDAPFAVRFAMNSIRFGLGVASTGIDCSSGFSVACGPDIVSLGFGAGGLVGDTGRALKAEGSIWDRLGETVNQDSPQAWQQRNVTCMSNQRAS